MMSFLLIFTSSLNRKNPAKPMGGGGGGGGIRVLWIEDFRQNWGWIMDF